jgi:translation elongation factor EF-4
MEYTVIFPETDRISSINGGCMSQEDFRKQVVDAMDTTTERMIVVESQPTQSWLINYQCDALLCAFPLQYLFGGWSIA